MHVKCACGRVFDIPEKVIPSAAGKIAVSRRKKRSGPVKQHACRWCHRLIAGRRGLEEHEANCDARRDDWEPVSDADFIALAWTPESAGD